MNRGRLKTPNCLFQNPNNSRSPKVHSATPKSHVAPRIPKTGYIQNIKGPWGHEGNQCLRFIVKPLLISKKGR